jgi:hypothetical protein
MDKAKAAFEKYLEIAPGRTQCPRQHGRVLHGGQATTPSRRSTTTGRLRWAWKARSRARKRQGRPWPKRATKAGEGQPAARLSPHRSNQFFIFIKTKFTMKSNLFFTLSGSLPADFHRLPASRRNARRPGAGQVGNPNP